MSEGAPVTNTASFPTTSEPTIPPAKPIEYFAGCRVFDVTNDEYLKLMRGSKKWDRWNKYFENNTENTNFRSLKRYLYKHPTKTVVLRNASSSDMVYFKPRGKGEV